MLVQEMYDIPDFLKEKMNFKSNRRGRCQHGNCNQPPMPPRPCRDGNCGRPPIMPEPRPCRDGNCDKPQHNHKPPRPCRDGNCDRPPMPPRPCRDGNCGHPLLRAFSSDEETMNRPPCPQYAYHPCLMGDLCASPAMREPVPFYQTYSDTLQMQQATEEERDLEMLKDMYPEKAKKIQMIVDEQVDKMDHDGSMMFDAAPDKGQIDRVVDTIYQQFLQCLKPKEIEGADQVFEGECEGKVCSSALNEETIKDLIRVLLYQEMYRRRCLKRRCERWW